MAAKPVEQIKVPGPLEVVICSFKEYDIVASEKIFFQISPKMNKKIFKNKKITALQPFGSSIVHWRALASIWSPFQQLKALKSAVKCQILLVCVCHTAMCLEYLIPSERSRSNLF